MIRGGEILSHIRAQPKTREHMYVEIPDVY